MKSDPGVCILGSVSASVYIRRFAPIAPTTTAGAPARAFSKVRAEREGGWLRPRDCTAAADARGWGGVRLALTRGRFAMGGLSGDGIYIPASAIGDPNLRDTATSSSV